jgi:hypothetical protein
MHYLGQILETREHAVYPVRVAIELEDGALDIGWTAVTHGAWATVIFGKIEVGDLVQVWDTQLEPDAMQYWVTAFLPTEGNPLLLNKEVLARNGDEVVIDGSVFVTSAEALPISQNAVPGKLDLQDDLSGKVKV